MFFHTPPIARFVKIPSHIYLQEPARHFYESLPELPWLAMSWTAKDLWRPRFWLEASIRKARLSMIRVLGREERRNARAFDDILVNSFFSRESVLRAFGIDSKVCYLGVDTDKFVNQNKSREPFVVSVGALVPPKNVEFLVQAVGKVSGSIRPRLVLIANTVDSRYLDQIRKLAEQLEVVFELKRRIEDIELIDILNRANTMLYAPRLEPFGYAPLEANACGLPVIAVAEGGVRETIRDGVNGILVEHDPQSMAEAIERLLEDDMLHQRLSQQATEHVRAKWSLQSSIDRLEQELSAKFESTTSLRGHG
jgi:glycosyltransferase involved in cell wall biosynthesis